ncbi:hypothetical protein [Saccharopolyspora dendranthemae]|uniref:hypothetical protein n=1 Tax=Saccharopolyspora dendranthemae TaxID=1181886 RepID=UPI001648CB22|nr:hypothetical protein [Saccharopolyspora dendranthemae]
MHIDTLAIRLQRTAVRELAHLHGGHTDVPFPDWVELEVRRDIADEELTQHENIPVTTVPRALKDVFDRMPVERWRGLVDQAHRRELIDDRDVTELRSWKEHVR